MIPLRCALCHQTGLDVGSRIVADESPLGYHREPRCVDGTACDERRKAITARLQDDPGLLRPSWTAIRKAITDSYYDARDVGGTMETAADLAATRVLGLWSQFRAAARPAVREERLSVRPEWLDTIDVAVTVLKGQGRYGIVTRLLRLRAALAADKEPSHG